MTEKQNRMLAAGTFHFGSGRDDHDNYKQALELEAIGYITIAVTQLEQEAIYNCTVTAKGRRVALASI